MKHLRNLLFGLLMLMISLPLIQQIMPIFNETPLKGAYELYKKPSPTIDSILNGTFQEAFNNYAEHNIGFRANLVRINNQIAYSLFDTALANGVVIGKEHYLYEINYIKALKGWDFVGMKSITNQVNKTAFINHKLREAGKTLLLIFAPGKTRFFPEYIPDAYNAKVSSDTTNYQAYIEQYGKTEVPLIDFNDWFVKMKDTASYPLFPQCGIHWSAYGVALALDSIIRYIEKDRNIDMVDFGWDSITVTDQLQNPDYDIAEGMNLLFTIPHYPMAYPRITYGNTNGKIKPNALVVSDSFYWNIFGKGYSNRIFADNNFWYYNKEVHNPEWPAPKKTQDIDILDAVNKTDIIIIMATEANLYRFPYGFIDRLYDAYTQGSEAKPNSLIKKGDINKEAEIAQIMKSIDNSPGWKQDVIKKAQKKGKSYEEMLLLDATWLWEQRHK